MNLLDGLLLRGDVPTAVRFDLGDVFGDLLNVRPPYPPTVPTPSTGTPWRAVVADISASLQALTARPDPSDPPALLLRYALALRTLRHTTHTTRTPTSSDGSGGGR